MDDAEARTLLRDERTRVEEALAVLDAAVQENMDDHAPDQRDPGDELFEAGRTGARREQLERELAAVERAEARLADGRYGLSIDSGEPIPDGRLRAQPTAERTVAEQERFNG